MADTLSKNSLDVVTERGTGVVGEGVTTQVGGGCLGYAENVAPLLDLFPEVLWVKCGVTSSYKMSDFDVVKNH